MSSFVVALEYAGVDVDIDQGGARVPLVEHAYNLDTAALADHGGHVLRFAFPTPMRGWPSTARYPRCVPCTDAVDTIIAAFIAAHLAGLRLAPPL